ncbi:MAG: MmcQ/YjbR family DNA-binding protein [Acidobacteriota bacterium]|nr:MmcQ/YjbR family DNA-binding protein [Acidobacteriota bacterium]
MITRDHAIMTLEKLRKRCLSYPGATEQIQWGADLVFKVGGKMFAVAATEPSARHRLSFKCSDETFTELLEIDGIDPAPYLARAKWVALERLDTIGDRELEARLREAYDLVFAKLTKKDQARIASGGVARKARR